MDAVISRPGNPAMIERGEETRGLLTGAAIEVIARDGWGGMTTRRVARRAGVNPALVHYHFGSVAALGRQAALHAAAAVFEPVASMLLDVGDVLRGINSALRATAAWDPRTPESRVVLEASVQAMRDPQLSAELQAMLAHFRSGLTRRLARAQARGNVTGCVDPAGTALLIAALLDGIGLHHLLDPSVDLSGVAGALREMLETPR
jgi:AcrR family transcriptional regulator